MVHAAKRKLIAQQAGGRRHAEHAQSCAALHGGSRLSLADVEYFGLQLVVQGSGGRREPGPLGCTVGACSACMLRMFVPCRQAAAKLDRFGAGAAAAVGERVPPRGEPPCAQCNAVATAILLCRSCGPMAPRQFGE